MSDRRTIAPGAGADAEGLPSTARDSVDRIASFLFVLGTLLLFLAAFLATVSGFEKSLQPHFERLVNEAIQVPVSPQPPGANIHLNLIQNVQNSDWVRIWGVKVDVTVKARDRQTWLYVDGQPKVLRYPSRDPETMKAIHARLLPATATVTTSVPRDSTLFSSILTVYAAMFLIAFFVHNRNVLNRQIQVIDDARDSRDQVASTARRIEKELASVRAQLREVEPAKRQDRDEIMRLQSEQQELRARLDQLVARERELRGQAERAVTLEEDSRVLEEMLEEATDNLAAKEAEIRELEKSLKRPSKSIGPARAKPRSRELLAKRMCTLYPRLEIDDRAIDDFVALQDEATRLRAEECIKRLAEDADNLRFRRKLRGLANQPSIYELGFAGKRRLYYAKMKNGRFRVLLIGAKNTQRSDLDYLAKIPKAELVS